MCYKKWSFLNLIWLINQTVEYSAIYYQQSSVTAVNLYADNSSSYWTVVGFGDSQPSLGLTKCQPICTLVPKKFLEIFSVWKRMSTRKHVPRVMTLLLNMSFLPISITRRLFPMQIFDVGWRRENLLLPRTWTSLSCTQQGMDWSIFLQTCE